MKHIKKEMQQQQRQKSLEENQAKSIKKMQNHKKATVQKQADQGMPDNNLQLNLDAFNKTPENELEAVTL